MSWIYVLRLIPRLYRDDAWTAAEEAVVERHYRRLLADHGRGVVVFAGRTERTDAEGFGIVVFEAADEASARAYMEADPCVAAGIMTAVLQGYRPAIG